MQYSVSSSSIRTSVSPVPDKLATAATTASDLVPIHNESCLLIFTANRILFAFKLNPYEKLNLKFTATLEEIRRQYRKISLMVHPDKCKHKDASTAFESGCGLSRHGS